MGQGSERAAGHRALPHTADIRVESWAPTREECVEQAVLGVVETFVDTSGSPTGEERTCRVEAATDEDLVVAVLDELVYLLDTTGAVPVSATLAPVDGGAVVRFRMVPGHELAQIGAVPKAVSLHELRLERRSGGWSCTVTLDV